MPRSWKIAIGVTSVVFVAVLALVLGANGNDATARRNRSGG